VKPICRKAYFLNIVALSFLTGFTGVFNAKAQSRRVFLEKKQAKEVF
jgi:hypothetical protein